MEKEHRKVIDKIISDIKNGTLYIGDKLPGERVLATELEMSRNSIREALRLLENVGVIESRQGSGNYIAANMADSLSLMMDIMMELKQFDKNELLNCRVNFEKMVCSMILDGSDYELVSQNAAVILAEPVESVEEERTQDKRFHAFLVNSTNNRLIIILAKAFADMFGEMVDSVWSFSDIEYKELLLNAHWDIVKALASGEKERCEQAIERHYQVVNTIAQKAQLDEYLASRVFKQPQNGKEKIDQLTELYLKNDFFEMVEEYLKKNTDKKYILWAADIQGLRYINEKYGMEMGDQIIQIIAKRMTDYDGYIFGGRIGGDKFCALMENQNIDVAAINDRLKHEYHNDLPIPNVSVKSGIYHIGKDTLSAHAMYVRAVLALQSIKNSYHTMITEYTDRMRSELLNSVQIEADAKNSLEKGEFLVYYQPKIDTLNGTIAGAEALVRWIHSELGFMSPGTFIPIFEKNGFMAELDLWVWEEVCKTIRQWKLNHMPIVPVSINVSRNSFEDVNLAEKIIELADRYEIEHSFLEIEITEYACLDNFDSIQKTISKLHNAGFTISLDDFGTGYSSMVVLSKIDIDIMKLDMSLIRNDDSSSNRNALEFALQLAEMMQLKTVAEGIETEGQVERIKSLGGDYIQGYFYSKPLPRKEFEVYMEKNIIPLA